MMVNVTADAGQRIKIARVLSMLWKCTSPVLAVRTACPRQEVITYRSCELKI